jgi:Spy/CpxP family protein refolding chaperone
MWRSVSLAVVLFCATSAWVVADDGRYAWHHQGMMDGGMMGGMDGMMHGDRALQMLDLSPEQRSKINSIRDDLRHKNWATLGKIQDEQARLRDLFAADKRDTRAISSTYASVQALQRQALDASLDAQNRMEALLTDAQREQLKQWRRNPWGSRGMGPGMMGPGGEGAGPGGMPRGGMMGR